MNILLLSLGGGGGNILRSVKALYQRDLAIAEQIDAAYAGRLSRSVTTRFADTNRYSLADVPEGERVLIGSAASGHIGARHDPEVARLALEESRPELETLIRQYSTVIVIATGGKGYRHGNDSAGDPAGETAQEARHPHLHSPIVRASRGGKTALR